MVVQENDFSTAAPTCPLLFQRGGSKRLYTFLHLTACGEASLRRKKASRHYAYLPTPVWGVGGERSETEGGRLPQEAIKMAPHTSKGRHLHLLFATYHFPFSAAPFHHYRGPPPPRQAVGGKYRGRGMISLLPEKQGRPVLRKSEPTPFVDASFKVPQFSPMQGNSILGTCH